jgi:hypothetical protein
MMGATNRQIEEAAERPSARFVEWLVGWLVPVLLVLLKLFPAVRARLEGTVPGKAGALFGLLLTKQHAEAFRRALYGLQHCEAPRASSGMHTGLWWIYMECAVQSASELGDSEQQAVLARLGEAPEPGGMAEAHTLAIVSRWRWKAGERDGAIEFARRAVLADPTWPQGHILLAWYGLVSGNFDPLPRLCEAVRVSPSCLDEIRDNQEFAKFPELIAALSNSPS